MTARLIALYKDPTDPAAFDKTYFNDHVPLVEKMPGLRGCTVTKLKNSITGTQLPYYMIAELVFDSMADLNASLASPEGKAAGANLMGFAAHLVTLLAGEETPIPISIG